MEQPQDRPGLYPASHRGRKQAPFPIAISSKSCRNHKFCNLLLQFLFPNVLFLSQFLQKGPFPKDLDKALQAFSRQLRRCVAQQGPTVGVVKPGGGMSLKLELELGRSHYCQVARCQGRLVKAPEHHTMQPNALPDVQCIMLAKNPTRRSTRILILINIKSSEVYRLANQFRKENAKVVGDKPVKNDAGEMSMSDDSKRKA